MTLTIDEAGLSSFLACLGLGLLHAMRRGAVPAEAGVWTLGRPRTWEPLEASARVPPVVIEVFKACDELSALQKLSPEKVDGAIESLMGRLEAVLREQEDVSWSISWEASDDSSS